MKITKIFSVIFSLIAIFLFINTISSCNGDDSNPDTNYFMTATINSDIYFESKSSLSQAIILNGDNVMGITGTSDDNRTIQLQVDLTNYTGGSGTLNEQQVTFIFSVEDSLFYSTITEGSGTLIVTEEDENHIKGSFNFTASLLIGNPSDFNLGNTITISNGMFNAKKVNQ